MSSVLPPYSLSADLRKIKEFLASSGLLTLEGSQTSPDHKRSARVIRNFRAGVTYPSFVKK